MIEPKVVFEAVLGRWRVEYQGVGRDDWRLYRYFPTLDEARAVAQRLTDDDLDGNYRVVDTQPDKAQPVYTVEARRGDNGSWNQIMPATTSSEAYSYAKQCAEEARSAGENNIEYRVVQTDADGAKIAQIVTPDGLGDLNPLNLLWIEKMEREDAARLANADGGFPGYAFDKARLTIPLTMNAYQQQAAKTAIYPPHSANQYLIAGLAGEVGELASIFAKHWRGDGDLNHDHAKAELGDVLWFVAMLADELGCNLSDVAQRNLTKLADRQQRGKLKGSGDNR